MLAAAASKAVPKVATRLAAFFNPLCMAPIVDCDIFWGAISIHQTGRVAKRSHVLGL